MTYLYISAMSGSTDLARPVPAVDFVSAPPVAQAEQANLAGKVGLLALPLAWWGAPSQTCPTRSTSQPCTDWAA